jgi:hypothetical protein
VIVSQKDVSLENGEVLRKGRKLWWWSYGKWCSVIGIACWRGSGGGAMGLSLIMFSFFFVMSPQDMAKRRASDERHMAYSALGPSLLLSCLSGGLKS